MFCTMMSLLYRSQDRPFALAEYIHVSKVVMGLLQRIRRWRSGILAHKLGYQ